MGICVTLSASVSTWRELRMMKMYAMTVEKGTKTPHSHVNPRIGSSSSTAFTAALWSRKQKQTTSNTIMGACTHVFEHPLRFHGCACKELERNDLFPKNDYSCLSSLLYFSGFWSFLNKYERLWHPGCSIYNTEGLGKLTGWQLPTLNPP